MFANLALSLSYTRRTLRHGLQGFWLFILCLCLGVMVIAATGLLADAVQSGISKNAKSLLGGDVEIYQTYTELTPEQRQYIEDNQGQLSLSIELRTMVVFNDTFQLVELKAVDAPYPLYGTLILDPPQDKAVALADRGLMVEAALLEKLDAQVGDTLTFGNHAFTINAVIAQEPDKVVNTFSFGAKAMTSVEALKATNLIVPGSLVRYRYRVQLPPETDLKAWRADLMAAFPEASWRVRDFTSAAPNVERVLEILELFLTLAGLTALLAGGIGISNSVNALINKQFLQIASLKSLGATQGFIFLYYLMLILVVASGAIVTALLLAAAVAAVGIGFLQNLLGFEVSFVWSWPILLQSALFGLLITLTFSLWQLGKTQSIKPASLFRGKLGLEGRPSWGLIIVNALFAVALVALAITTAVNQVIAIVYCLSIIAAIAVFYLGSRVLLWVSQLVQPKTFWVRQGLQRLTRPGARIVPSILSLGLGLTFLMSISLIDANLQESIRTIRPVNAPTHFFIDIQKQQQQQFIEILKENGAIDVQTAPMIRGTISKINGIPAAEAEIDSDVAWAIRGDRGISFSASQPGNITLLEGRWWQAEDYQDTVLVSFDKRLADGMGLKLGDTLTYNVLGEEIVMQIFNLREVDYSDFEINFSTIVSPGALEIFPRSYIATAKIDTSQGSALRDLAQALPNISAIPVDQVIQQIADLSDDLAIAVRLTAVFTVIAALLVLIGALVANEEGRAYEIVVLKVLGAKRRDVLKIYLAEYAGIILISSIVALLAGNAAAYTVTTQFEFIDFSIMPTLSAGILLSTMLLILMIALPIILRSFNKTASGYLRNE